MQGTEGLPFETIGRKAGAVTLTDRVAAKFLAPIFVMALGAGEVELAPPGVEIILAPRIPVCRRAFDIDRDRLAACKVCDIGRQREEVIALIGERRAILIAFAAKIDPAFNIDEPAALLIDLWVMGRRACQRAGALGMTVATGICDPVRLLEQRFAPVDPEKAGIGEVIVLKGLRLRLQEGVTGLQRRRLWRGIRRGHSVIPAGG